jgi:hypothetical protein
MAKQLTPRKRLNGLFPFLRSVPKSETPAMSERRKKLVRRIANVAARPVMTAFRKAGLNINNREDRDQLLVWLAWSVYGGKSAGAPRKWGAKKLRRLLDDVQALRSRDSTLTETACCKLLSKGKEAEGRYKDRNVDTLRRVLQEAKALDRTAKVLATPLKEVIARPESTGSTGSRETN